jgi:hypothetical protein
MKDCDPSYIRVNRVLEMREDVPSLIVGTLVKEANDPDETPLHPDTVCRPSDQLFLEDESGRVALKVDNVHQYCTGVVVGVKGSVDKVSQKRLTFSSHKYVVSVHSLFSSQIILDAFFCPRREPSQSKSSFYPLPFRFRPCREEVSILPVALHHRLTLLIYSSSLPCFAEIRTSLPCLAKC